MRLARLIFSLALALVLIRPAMAADPHFRLSVQGGYGWYAMDALNRQHVDYLAWRLRSHEHVTDGANLEFTLTYSISRGVSLGFVTHIARGVARNSVNFWALPPAGAERAAGTLTQADTLTPVISYVKFVAPGVVAQYRLHLWRGSAVGTVGAVWGFANTRWDFGEPENHYAPGERYEFSGSAAGYLSSVGIEIPVLHHVALSAQVGYRWFDVIASQNLDDRAKPPVELDFSGVYSLAGIMLSL